MGDAEDKEQLAELVSRLFALLTAKLEDASAIAANCQARLTAGQLRSGAADLEDLAAEAGTLAAAASALLRDPAIESPADDE
jgi:hypothetical protein